jgi:hypothetical protein
MAYYGRVESLLQFSLDVYCTLKLSFVFAVESPLVPVTVTA